MFSFSKILKYVWPQIRKYQWAFYAILVIFSARVVVDTILRPLYFKKIIDLLSRGNVGHMLLSDDLFKLVFIIIGLNILVLLIARSGKFLYLALKQLFVLLYS